ncbi:MAG: hypothetical protein WCC21_20165 [Candidatus Acidiferrales bacterium]
MPKPVRPHTLASHYALRRNGTKTVTVAQFGLGDTLLFAGASLRAIDFLAAPGLSSPTTQHSPTSEVWEAGIHAATACDKCAPECFNYDDLTENMTVFSSRSRNV